MTQNFEQIPEPEEPRIESSISDQNSVIENKNWTDTRFGRLTASALVGLEISPANELVRLALYGAAQASTHSPIVSALTLGVSTFAIEGVGSYTTADLMDADMGNNMIQKIHNRIQKSRILSKINTGVGTEAGISMFMGVPATMVIKQSQLPERTREENRKYGLRMSLGVAAVLGTEALSLSETVSHPSLKNGLILAGSVGVLAGGVSRVKNSVTSRKHAKSQKNQNESEL